WWRYMFSINCFQIIQEARADRVAETDADEEDAAGLSCCSRLPEAAALARAAVREDLAVLAEAPAAVAAPAVDFRNKKFLRNPVFVYALNYYNKIFFTIENAMPSVSSSC